MVKKQELKICGKTRSGDVHLNKMGADLKLHFNPYFQLSGHTFTTNALNNDIPTEYVSSGCPRSL